MPYPGSEGGSGDGLPSPFYFETDDADKRLTIRGEVNNVDSEVFKFGSGEADMYKINRIMGGLRQVELNGEELFLIRQSTAGDLRAVSVGNMDTNTANSLVSGAAGWRESRMLPDVATQNIAWTLGGAQGINALGGTRMYVDITSNQAASWREFTLQCSAVFTGVKYNLRILALPSLELLSEHQPEAEFMAGGGLDEFKVDFAISANNVIPLLPAFPVPAGQQFRIVLDFDRDITAELSPGSTLNGFKLELGRIQSVVEMTEAERNALTGSQALWNGREVYQTDGQSGKYIRLGGRWQYMQAFESRNVEVVKEVAIIEVASGAWMNKAIVLGGMEFRWSSNTLNTGNLTMVRATGITRSSTGSGQVLMKNGAHTSTENNTVWNDTLTQLHSLYPMTSDYWLFEYHICTRNNEAIPCYWKITVMNTGNNSLVISGEYTGQRITA